MTKTYQAPDGTLLPEVRKRIHAVRDKLGYSWQNLADEFGFSNTFVHHISNDAAPHAIRAKHVESLIQNLEGLEVKAGILKVADMSTPFAASAISTSSTTIGAMSLEELVNAIAAKGFSVTISPLAKV